MAYLYTKFGVNMPKQTKVMSGNWISIFSNSDLDHRHLGSNPKLRLDISYPYSKFGVNRPQQTKVIERKPKVDARIKITRFSLKITLSHISTLNHMPNNDRASHKYVFGYQSLSFSQWLLCVFCSLDHTFFWFLFAWFNAYTILIGCHICKYNRILFKL